MTQKMHNGGFNCIASQVLILPQDWPHSDDLLDAIRLVAMETVPRIAYYPGADRRRKAIVAAHPDAEFLDLAEDNPSPRILVHHLPHSRINDICFKTEAFSSVLAEHACPATGRRPSCAARSIFAMKTFGARWGPTCWSIRKPSRRWASCWTGRSPTAIRLCGVEHLDGGGVFVDAVDLGGVSRPYPGRYSKRHRRCSQQLHVRSCPEECRDSAFLSLSAQLPARSLHDAAQAAVVRYPPDRGRYGAPLDSI